MQSRMGEDSGLDIKTITKYSKYIFCHFLNRKYGFVNANINANFRGILDSDSSGTLTQTLPNDHNAEPCLTNMRLNKQLDKLCHLMSCIYHCAR